MLYAFHLMFYVVGSQLGWDGWEDEGVNVVIYHVCIVFLLFFA